MSVEFFLIITPGLESIAREELLEKWPKLSKVYAGLFQATPSLKVEKGGLTLHCAEAEGWLLNAYLKIPSRILQRFESFRASDVPKLYEKTRRLEWTRFFREDEIKVESSTHASRLSMKDQIEDVILSALRDAREHQPFRKSLLKVPQTIFARIVDDHVQLSIDTSGEPLYQRGYKTKTVEAPLRETLASAFVYASLKSIGESSYILDPMCGSGTFLTEFIGFNIATRTRTFAFQNFPCFAKILPTYKLYDLKSTQLKVYGFDQDEDSLEATRENLAILKKKINFEIEIQKQDLFAATKSDIQDTLILVNPPFGKRIEISGGVSKYYQSVIDTLIDVYQPKAIGILCPSEVRGLVTRGHYEWVKNSSVPISTTTGGLEVKFELLRKV